MVALDRDRLEAALREGFAPLIARHEVDLVSAPAEDEAAIELQADAWTLHCDGWPLATAWLALDAEPESEDQRRETLVSMFGHGELPAFQATDALTGHALSAALRASGDALSLTLAELVATTT